MKSYYYSLNYYTLLLGTLGSSSSFYFTANAIFEKFELSSFIDWMMFLFSILAAVVFIVFFSLLVGKVLNINQKIILKNDYFEFPNYIFFMKPRIIQYTDIVSSDLMSSKRGYLIDQNIKLVLKNKTMFILGRSLGNGETDILDLQHEVLKKVESK